MQLITPPVNQRSSGWISGLLSNTVDLIALCVIITVFYLQFRPLLWFSPLCSAVWIFYLRPCYAHGEGFWSSLWSGSLETTTSRVSPPTLIPTSASAPSLSAQTDKYLFPWWRLLTASQPGKSPVARSCRLCLHLTGGKLHSRYHSPSSVSAGRSSRGPSSIRGRVMTLLPCNQRRDSLIDFHEPPLISRHKAYLTNQQRQVIKLEDSLVEIRANRIG